jgi:heptosyltransferase II
VNVKPFPKIVVRTPNWIGDHVMAQPFYQALRQAYPDSEIHFLCSESLRGFDDGDLCTYKKVVLSSAKKWGPEFKNLARELQTQNYDLAISLTASFSSSILFWLARIPVRIGFSQSGSGLFLSDSLKWKGIHSKKHKAELFLELLNFMTGKKWPLKVPTSHSFSPSKKQIVVAPGASISLRVWPYFEDLLKSLSSDYPEYEILVVGAKSESHWHEKLKKLTLPRVRDRIETTSLPELTELCRESALVIANDSGTGHLAGALARTPTLVIFGPGDPHYIKPLGPQVTCETPKGVPCHPCEKPYCHEKYGYQACLRSLSLAQIQSTLLTLIPR